jgi:3-oxoacyl-[acyl-carrier-protein] synthase II
MSKRRVVITGLGSISPIGMTMQETWESALAGRSGIGPITRFDVAAFSSRIAGEVKGFEPERYIEVKELKKMDIFSQFAIAASEEAVTDAGLRDGGGYDRARIGVVFGVGLGGLYILEKYHEAYLNGGPKKISPFLIPGMISNLAPGNVSIRFGFRGVSFTIQSACTSATHAIGESARMIADGLQDAMVTGGSESAISPTGVGGFCAMKALSTRNDEPHKASRPFDKGRDGFVMGEGGVVLVLEEFEAAKRRGATIYAEVLGYGTSSDAYHITAPSEDGQGAATCMSNALASAGLKGSDVQYVNAHGTSTPVGDVAETLAIKRVFGPYAKDGLMVSSTKSVTGHLLGAAGAIEAALCVLAVAHGSVPPTMNLDDQDPECDLDYVPNVARRQEVRIAMSNSFGFGGTNASLIVGKVA